MISRCLDNPGIGDQLFLPHPSVLRPCATTPAGLSLSVPALLELGNKPLNLTPNRRRIDIKSAFGKHVNQVRRPSPLLPQQIRY